jgi:6-pyruvoyltetrahydropterin/6-carboxytetrahydropterin synthase
VRNVCDSLDHKLLLPGHHPDLSIEPEGEYFHILPPDQRKLIIPKDDCLILPILNTSAERIAVYICDEINHRLKNKFEFMFSKVEVEVEETPGQSAIYTWTA